MPMQPSPMADTSRPLEPGVRVCTRTSPALVLVVGDVVAPGRLRPRVVRGDALGDGQVGHVVRGSGAVPVPLARRRADDVARPDLGNRAAPGLDASPALG